MLKLRSCTSNTTQNVISTGFFHYVFHFILIYLSLRIPYCSHSFMLDEEIKTECKFLDDKIILADDGKFLQRVTKNLKEGLEKCRVNINLNKITLINCIVKMAVMVREDRRQNTIS